MPDPLPPVFSDPDRPPAVPEPLPDVPLSCPEEFETATGTFDPAGYDPSDCAGCGRPKSEHSSPGMSRPAVPFAPPAPVPLPALDAERLAAIRADLRERHYVSTATGLELAAEIERLRPLVYSYGPNEPFSPDGVTWKEEVINLTREADRLKADNARLIEFLTRISRERERFQVEADRLKARCEFARGRWIDAVVSDAGDDFHEFAEREVDIELAAWDREHPAGAVAQGNGEDT